MPGHLLDDLVDGVAIQQLAGHRPPVDRLFIGMGQHHRLGEQELVQLEPMRPHQSVQVTKDHLALVDPVKPDLGNDGNRIGQSRRPGLDHLALGALKVHLQQVDPGQPFNLVQPQRPQRDHLDRAARLHPLLLAQLAKGPGIEGKQRGETGLGVHVQRPLALVADGAGKVVLRLGLRLLQLVEGTFMRLEAVDVAQMRIEERLVGRFSQRVRTHVADAHPA